MAKTPIKVPRGMKLVFCRYIVRSGKRIYPKNAKCFCFLVPAEK